MSDTQSFNSYSSEEKIRYHSFKPKTGSRRHLNQKAKGKKPSHVPTNPPELQSLESLIKETTQFSYFDQNSNTFDADKLEEESTALDGLRKSIVEKNRQNVKRWSEGAPASTSSMRTGTSSLASSSASSLPYNKIKGNQFRSSHSQKNNSSPRQKKTNNNQYQRGKQQETKTNHHKMNDDKIEFGEPIIPLNLEANGSDVVESLDDPEFLDDLKEQIGEYIIKLNRSLQDLFPTQVDDDLEEYDRLIKELSGEQEESDEENIFSDNVWQKKEAPSMVLYRSLSKIDDITNGIKL